MNDALAKKKRRAWFFFWSKRGWLPRHFSQALLCVCAADRFHAARTRGHPLGVQVAPGQQPLRASRGPCRCVLSRLWWWSGAHLAIFCSGYNPHLQPSAGLAPPQPYHSAPGAYSPPSAYTPPQPYGSAGLAPPQPYYSSPGLAPPQPYASGGLAPPQPYHSAPAGQVLTVTYVTQQQQAPAPPPPAPLVMDDGPVTKRTVMHRPCCGCTCCGVQDTLCCCDCCRYCWCCCCIACCPDYETRH